MNRFRPAGLAKNESLARSIFIHATKFALADRHLRDAALHDAEANTTFRMPGMVLSAFASELFLKCLLVIEGKEIPGWRNKASNPNARPRDPHHLKNLFELLPRGTQFRVGDYWDFKVSERHDQLREIEIRDQVKIPRDLPTALAECGGAFVGLRYIYEDPSRTNFYITDLPDVLHDVVLERTHWDELARRGE